MNIPKMERLAVERPSSATFQFTFRKSADVNGLADKSWIYTETPAVSLEAAACREKGKEKSL